MKQDKLKLYILDMKYVRDLHNVDDRVQSISPQIHKSKRLCTKELDWIQNQDAIVKKANKLYRLVQDEAVSYGLKKRCLDFKKLESVLLKRNKNKA